jgi:hypothetical protein
MSNKIKAEDFKILKADKKNFKHSTIERGGLTSTFTIGELEGDLISLDRNEREATSQIKLSKAALENIERNHKFVSKMSEEQLATAAYLHETRAVLAKAEKTLKQIKDAKKKYNEVLSTVYKVFGFVETNLPDDNDSLTAVKGK